MKSVETAKLKQCEPIFLEKGNSLKLLKRKNLNHRQIQTEKNQKNQKASWEYSIKMKQLQPQSLKLKTENTPIDRMTRMIWI